MYKISIRSFVYFLIPPLRRKARALAIAIILLNPHELILQLFTTYIERTNHKISATGQVLMLKYNIAKLLGIPRNTVRITYSNRTDFRVYLPITLSDEKRELAKWYILRHKAAGFSHEIVIE